MQARDEPRLRELHAGTGFEFPFPEKLLSAKVWVDEQDRPQMMVGAKVIAEAVLISSKEGTPGMRLAMLQALEREVRRDCNAAGISQAVTWIPDSIWKAYSRRLRGIGWLATKFRTMVYMGGV